MNGVALVRRPGPRLAEGIVTYQRREPVDAELAERQHAAYVSALREHGWRPVEVPAAEEHPDAPFIEDMVVSFAGLAVLTRPGAPERRGELAGAASAIREVSQELGLQTVGIDSPGTLDGGDVLQVGSTVYVGRSGRTNDEGIAQLSRALAARGRTVVPVELTGALHLKSAVTALPDGTLIGNPDHVDLPGLLASPEETGAHVVLLGGDTVLLADSAPETARLLTGKGLNVVAVGISEFEKLEGCVTCLSVLIDA
ncbi:dimethylarginine dimethylaminohydrolase family protein [Flindersiella endophytica]